jgi:hypothetical protein
MTHIAVDMLGSSRYTAVTRNLSLHQINNKMLISIFQAVLQIWIRMLLGLLDLDPLVRGTDPDFFRFFLVTKTPNLKPDQHPEHYGSETSGSI